MSGFQLLVIFSSGTISDSVTKRKSKKNNKHNQRKIVHKKVNYDGKINHTK